MKVVFDDEALDDLRRISAEIARDNPAAARELVGRILDKVARLASPELTYMGRPGLDPGTRELIEYPYIVVYEVREGPGEVVVFSIVHGARYRKPRTVER